ncbi:MULTISPECIES: flagellar biosynthesis protein FliQ [unclassified Acutalibacter]|mgnify:CR=1 FL=1|jgi:flagellar biosynthetic protein FliQ|uniref:flagellar biosynthesis protein FliQ n=1 Tax=unclassified Acutalibacter TaxID=2620728 RepID=UPI001929DC9A|nr:MULTISPECIES: flagellar biosynthesis protein FliQ [unclassified Acutalibacter]
MDLPVVDVFRDAVGVVIRLAAPMLLLSMVVGVIVAILQAVTQIHEQTISFILKLIVVVLFLIMGGSWMMSNLQAFTMELFELMKG